MSVVKSSSLPRSSTPNGVASSWTSFYSTRRHFSSFWPSFHCSHSFSSYLSSSIRLGLRYRQTLTQWAHNVGQSRGTTWKVRKKHFVGHFTYNNCDNYQPFKLCLCVCNVIEFFWLKAFQVKHSKNIPLGQKTLLGVSKPNTTQLLSWPSKESKASKGILLPEEL